MSFGGRLEQIKHERRTPELNIKRLRVARLQITDNEPVGNQTC
jgi:hypothetical protein